MYVDTNNSVRSWQILYVNHVLQYVNGNAALLGVSGLQLVKKNSSTLLLLSCFTDMEEVTSTESSEPKVQKKSRKRVKAIHAKIKEQVCWFI